MAESEPTSCFVQNLAAYMALDDRECDALATLESSRVEHDGNITVFSRGQQFTQVYIVQRGWLFSSTNLVDGRRHILQIHHPGDLVGIYNLPWHNAHFDLETFERCTLCPLSRTAIGILLAEQPRIGALLMALSAREHAIANDLLRITARLRATDRILYLLMLLLCRLRITNRDMTDTMRFPLTQTHIGDMLGLTNVSVSKAMGELERAGWIARDRTTLTLLRIEETIEQIDFENRYATIADDWFPPANHSADGMASCK